jgi:uncharacterized protein HemY
MTTCLIIDILSLSIAWSRMYTQQRSSDISYTALVIVIIIPVIIIAIVVAVVIAVIQPPPPPFKI